MQLTDEQLTQLRAALHFARSGIRQLTIAASDVRAMEVRAAGKSVSDEDIALYVAHVSHPFIEPIESALAVLEARR